MVIFGRTRQILGTEAAVFMGMEDDGEYVTNRMIFGCVWKWGIYHIRWQFNRDNQPHDRLGNDEQTKKES